MTEQQSAACQKLAEYLQRLLREDFFDEDELPEYEWVLDTLEEAGFPVE